jgi:hypothetical protein
MKNILLILIPLIYLSVSNAEEHPPMLQTMQDGIKLELEGVVVCDENGRKIHDKKLKVKLGSQPSLKKAIDVLGPGYLSQHSGTGGISWIFSDDSVLTTSIWPRSLETKVYWVNPATTKD